MSSLTHKIQNLLVAIVLLIATAANIAPAQAAGALAQGKGSGKELWQHVNGTPPPARKDAKPAVKPRKFNGLKLNQGGMKALLVSAPKEHGKADKNSSLVLSLPDPTGAFEDFAVEESSIMEDGLAAKHPEIKTYRGSGISNPAATIRFDLTPLGFHASVRSPQGAWYIDPYYQLEDSLYASYYGRDLLADPDQVFVEREAEGAELSVDHGYYHAADSVTLHGSGFAPNSAITLTISDPTENFPTRTASAAADELGAFDAEFVADPDGNLDTHIVEASDGAASALASYQVVRDDDPTVDPPTGDVLRIYRLALITDPGYAAFFGGSANVTPAKVTLMNRVDQLYEDDLSIRMVLVNNNDLLNLDTWAQAIAPNGPCGAAGCFTQSQVTSCSSTSRARYVVGQIIGASNYDIGHLALGAPGGGVANLGVVGRNSKAGGCTGIPTPTGDYYAVDYVAHEMGHQFSGNHPFNGNQLNCSAGNRNASTSVEPGSGSSVMAYAGICLTDDLQAHSDPYFSQRSQQEISTYTSSNQNPINEVQTVSMRHFGGGNEVQVVTFGPGYASAATVQPLSLAINAAPSAASRGGAEENGSTVTIATSSAHTLQVGDSVTVSGVGVAEYNGTWTVTAVPSTRSFQYENPTTGLATSGGGSITLVVPGATEDGTTVTINTAAPHNRAVGDVVTLSNVGVAGYNGTYTITAVPGPRTFQYTAAAAGLAASGGGSATYFSPFQVRIAGNDSDVIGGSGMPYSAANLQAAINAIAGFGGTVSVSGASSTGFTVTYSGASAGIDVPMLELVNLECSGCFASVEETNHGGANDSFTLSYAGNVSVPIAFGGNYTSTGIRDALLPLLPAGATVTVANFGGNGSPSNNGFMVTFSGSLAATNLPEMSVQDFTPGASGFVGETDKGGPVDNKGGIIEPTGDAIPVVTVPETYTIPLRTPFSLTGSATDGDNDALIYSWEQNDRGASAGTSLLNNTKLNGPLFAMFPQSGVISTDDSLQYDSPGENHLTTNPTRVFPDLQQILDNNTNADSGACPAGPIAPPANVTQKECFAEFLPTSDYVGYTGGGFNNSDPLSLHFRLTARDGRGGTSSADTTLLLASNSGPFRVTSPNTAETQQGGATLTVTWDVAGTDAAPINTTAVKISLSVDGGYTYPYVLAENTENDGTQDVTLPNVSTTEARVKIEAVDNIFFDLSNANFSIQAVPELSSSLGEGGSQALQYSDSLAPAVTVTATDLDTLGKDLSASASGLPAGLSLAVSATSADSSLPGSRTWKVAGATTAAPGSYPVSVTVTDETGGSAVTNFTLNVTQEDAAAAYTGDMLVFTSATGTTANVVLRATVQDSAIVAGSNDTQPGDIRNATITFKENGTTLCAAQAAALINDALTTGTASCSVSLGLGEHSIDILVAGYYVGSSTDIVEVAQPNGSFITGGGYLSVGSASGSIAAGGSYAADSGSKANFGFNVTYKNAKNAQGHASIVFRKGGHVYQIKSTAVSSLGITQKNTFSLADFRSKANLFDITDPNAPVTLGSNLTLQITLTDKGNPGTNDSLGITLWDGNTLLFSSAWKGGKTQELPLAGGNLVIH